MKLSEIKKNQDNPRLIKDETSEVFQIYQQGIDLADFAIDTKLFEKAMEGDINALNKFELRKKLRKAKK